MTEATSPERATSSLLFLLGNSGVSAKIRRVLTAYAVGLELWAVVKWVRRKLRERSTYKVSVFGDDAIYEDLQHWLLRQIPEEERHALIARTERTGEVRPMDPGEEVAPPTLKLFYDGSTSQDVRIDGHKVEVRIDSGERGGDKMVEAYIKRQAEKIIFEVQGLEGHAAIQRFIDKVTVDHYAEDKTPDLFIARWSSWESRRDLGRRGIDRVFLPQEQKDRIVGDLERFLAMEGRYLELDMPWHRGYLFHGPPGTGKSSLAKALANHFGLDVFYIALSSVHNDGNLTELIGGLRPRSILLIEDADVFHAATDRDDGQKGVTLPGLLNNLDGVLTPHGLITMVTTNNLAALDDALVRKGRFDLIEPIEHVTAEQVNDLVFSMLGIYSQFDEVRAGIAPVDVVECVKANLLDPSKAYAAIEELVSV